MSRLLGALIACSAMLSACGQQPVPAAATDARFSAAMTPPTSGLDDYARSTGGGWGGGPRGGGWGGGGWGGGGCGWDGGCGGYGGGWGGGWGNPWGWPYYVPPVYVSGNIGNPFAPPPLAAGPWFSPFFGFLGYAGI
jgi:hypothetical protein